MTERAHPSDGEALPDVLERRFDDLLTTSTRDVPEARRPDRAQVYVSHVATPLGPMVMGTTDTHVCLLEFADRPKLPTQLRRLARGLGCRYVRGRREPGERLESELREYWAGTIREFGTPLLTPGSTFQQRVWTALRDVRFGETRSYRDLAESIDAPTAVRAVASANGDNRIAILIPCHRVIGSDGGLTGYGGGLWRKRRLLQHEKATFKDCSSQLELAYT